MDSCKDWQNCCNWFSSISPLCLRSLVMKAAAVEISVFIVPLGSWSRLTQGSYEDHTISWFYPRNLEQTDDRIWVKILKIRLIYSFKTFGAQFPESFFVSEDPENVYKPPQMFPSGQFRVIMSGVTSTTPLVWPQLDPLFSRKSRGRSYTVDDVWRWSGYKVIKLFVSSLSLP